MVSDIADMRTTLCSSSLAAALPENVHLPLAKLKPTCHLAAACENPNVLEIVDCCTKGLKLPAQIEVGWLCADKQAELDTTTEELTSTFRTSHTAETG